METEDLENKIYIAVKGVLINEGKALILRRADIKLDDKIGWWEFAGGTLEFGESPEETLVREYREETGLDVKPGKLLYVSSIHNNPKCQIIVITYLCGCDDCGKVKISDEHLAYKWAGVSELNEYLADDIRENFYKNNLWGIFSE